MRAPARASRAVISGSKPNRFGVGAAQRARDVAAHRLVAGLHVGEVEVRQHVAVRREAAVAHRVPEVQHAVRPAEEARAEARRRRARRGSARAAPGQSCRVVLEVGVLHDHDVARCSRRERLRIAAPLPRFSWMADRAGRCVPARGAARGSRCVPSVEWSSTQMISFAHRRRVHLIDDEIDRVALVVDGHEHRERDDGAVEGVRARRLGERGPIAHASTP